CPASRRLVVSGRSRLQGLGQTGRELLIDSAPPASHTAPRSGRASRSPGVWAKFLRAEAKRAGIAGVRTARPHAGAPDMRTGRPHSGNPAAAGASANATRRAALP